MSYYVIQSLLILVLAYFLGAWTGCAIRSWFSYRRYEKAYWANPEVFAEGFDAPTAAGFQRAEKSTRTYIPIDDQFVDGIEEDIAADVDLQDHTHKITDLRLINRIGEGEIEVLRQNGVNSFTDIANWSPKDVEIINIQIGGSKRVQQENWIEQAALLATGAISAYATQVQNEGAETYTDQLENKTQQGDDKFPAETSPDQPDTNFSGQEPISESASEDILPDVMEAPTTEQISAEQIKAVSQVPDPQVLNPDDSASNLPSDMPSLAEIADTHDNLSGETLSSDKNFERVEMDEEPFNTEVTGEVQQSATGENFSASVVESLENSAVRSEENSDLTEEQLSKPASEETTDLVYEPGSARDVMPEAIRKPADNLKRISGIGVIIERRLNRLGVHHYDQIAGWTDDQIEEFNEKLEFTDRIQQEKWQEQAEILSGGGETDFSMKFDRGEIGLNSDED